MVWAYMLLATALVAAPRAPTHSSGQDFQTEDPSCEAINNAYIATGEAPEFTVSLSQLKPDGTLKPYAEIRVGDSKAYVKRAISSKWLQVGRPFSSTFDSYGPVFTVCRLIGHELIHGDATDHYSATWHSFPYSASYEMWISAGNGRAIKVLRDYSKTTWEFSFPVAVEFFDYSHKPTFRSDVIER